MASRCEPGRRRRSPLRPVAPSRRAPRRRDARRAPPASVLYRPVAAPYAAMTAASAPFVAPLILCNAMAMETRPASETVEARDTCSRRDRKLPNRRESPVYSPDLFRPATSTRGRRPGARMGGLRIIEDSALEVTKRATASVVRRKRYHQCPESSEIRFGPWQSRARSIDVQC